MHRPLEGEVPSNKPLRSLPHGVGGMDGSLRLEGWARIVPMCHGADWGVFDLLGGRCFMQGAGPGRLLLLLLLLLLPRVAGQPKRGRDRAEF